MTLSTSGAFASLPAPQVAQVLSPREETPFSFSGLSTHAATYRHGLVYWSRPSSDKLAQLSTRQRGICEPTHVARLSVDLIGRQVLELAETQFCA